MGRGEAEAQLETRTYQVMMYCRCSFLRVTRVCPPTGPPGTVLPAESVGSVSVITATSRVSPTTHRPTLGAFESSQELCKPVTSPVLLSLVPARPHSSRPREPVPSRREEVSGQRRG